LVPLFVLAAPLAGHLLASIRPQMVALGICVFLLDNARLPLLENWLRPLRGPNSILKTARGSNYFPDIQPMDNRDAYQQSVELAARSGCANVGIDNRWNPLEYRLQATLLQRNPQVRFQHAGVENSPARYTKPDTPQPCAVMCLDCAGDEARQQMHRAQIAPAQRIGRFLVFVR